MLLATWNNRTKSFKAIRDLTNEERLSHEEYSILYRKAESRLNLFSILHLNYTDWVEFIKNPKRQDFSLAKLKLNQLMLNILTCTYAIHEHFERLYTQINRKNENAKTQYDEFQKTLRNTNWAYAFFLIFEIMLNIVNYQ